jgi:MoxR-like ATPase
MLNKVRTILSSQFVFCDDVAEALAVALTAKKNAILWGPGGHAKSAMVKAVIDGLHMAQDAFFLSFGEGMDEATLWGGLDFGKLETEKVLHYFPSQSFLAARIAVFEELFDAPASVLLSLKDTLTAKELRKGSQRCAMKTEVIIACTNREPQEIAEMGPAAQALIERFPLQLRVAWPSYNASDYKALFEKVNNRRMNGFTPVLAEVIAKATAEGNFISPRTAVHALDIVVAAAEARGVSEVSKEHLTSLRFLPGLETIGETIAAEVEAALRRAEAGHNLEVFEKRLAACIGELVAAETPIKCLQLVKRFKALEDEVAKLAVPDELTERRNKARQAVGVKIAEARQKAEDLTRV